MEENNLIDRLNRHPHIKARVKALLDVAENTSGELITADAAELAVIEGVRRMGQDTLQEWAIVQNAKIEQSTKSRSDVKCHAKKNFTGIQHSEK